MKERKIKSEIILSNGYTVNIHFVYFGKNEKNIDVILQVVFLTRLNEANFPYLIGMN